ncbi:MAG: DUF3810 family protein [Flavobacteriaceae bacterium]|nr:DUF3810 family protein [Flavobacteriaceae bacterium]
MSKTNGNKLLSLLLFAQIGLVYFLSKFPNFIEKNYTNGIYQNISVFLRKIFGSIPFSVGDIIYFTLILLIIRFLYQLIKYKNRKQLLIKFLAGFSVFYFLFYFLWGLNYSRLPITKSLAIEKVKTLPSGKFDIEPLKKLTNYLIFKTAKIQLQLSGNDTLPVIVPYTKSEILKLTNTGYLNLSKQFKQFQYQPASLKKSLFSVPLTYMGFAGYFNPLTGEAQVDYLIPKITLPMTCSHEVAHQLGIASESEANFIGYLAANFHDDLYFQYSANLLALRYALSDIYRYDPKLYQKYIENLPKGIIKNIQELREFWLKYQNPAEPIFKAFYDNYLKANQQEDGLESYNRMVDLLIAYDKKYVLK